MSDSLYLTDLVPNQAMQRVGKAPWFYMSINPVYQFQDPGPQTAICKICVSLICCLSATRKNFSPGVKLGGGASVPNSLAEGITRYLVTRTLVCRGSKLLNTPSNNLSDTTATLNYLHPS